jgi:hypothetical protein
LEVFNGKFSEVFRLEFMVMEMVVIERREMISIWMKKNSIIDIVFQHSFHTLGRIQFARPFLDTPSTL